MNRRTLLAGAAALAAAPALAPMARAQAARTRIVFWHAMEAALGDEVNRIATEFNASQPAYEVVPVFKGTYGETLTATIAASRAGQAPHLVQVFEVGTGTMLTAGPAVKQIWQLAKETGVTLDPAAYLGGVRGYYSLPDGRLASMPFNSSSALMWYNKDAFEKAGLNPDAPPATWQQVVEACRALKAKSATSVPMTTAWPTWIQLEQYAAMHNLVYATRANGFEGLDTELRINTPPFVKHIQRLLDMSKEGLFRYGGRGDAPNPLFISGEAAITFGSSGSRANIARGAKFRWAPALLPTDPEVDPKPINSIIGGASLWAMTAPGRNPAEYKGVAEFLKFLAVPANDATWHQHTGYVPVTFAGYELSRQQGFYDRNPGADLPIKQLTRGQVTPNSRGFRLGRMPEIRNIIEEELERALQGQQGAQAMLDTSVVRGNRVLREFQKSVKA
ncbi:sn-glycerol 3-phosphate ABC transporter periplasmic binding protein [Rhodovastum atsumiense]|uniref:sn-glycerol-3-phosphate-binding periplasmic protein UgpB n=1 Tax=Rhodovastum atsumiense TaxID=504468 RepID=A0A5M6IYL3_9PROT|nr:sn-glycerol-3-phosphate ABC transporter substrate-binding protein UgpB [Rhodovastum atsumiense]KAA5612458.1 sn-glycerol-3-phosphate ABC transporter substrate-binding protein UgpB [Rhodovastum atsumiense]CAH2600370.1 sn-glycerol 3-phosphate ABC transporter periplasmic binding protein [Rhodovastum atsumiense]